LSNLVFTEPVGKLIGAEVRIEINEKIKFFCWFSLNQMLKSVFVFKNGISSCGFLNFFDQIYISFC
jgi:hypothetical protein